MKRKVLPLFFVLLLACNSTETPSLLPAIEDLPKNATFETSEELPGLNAASVYNNQGDLVETGAVLNGKREGTWTLYYSNGTIREMTGYVNGRKQGISIKVDNRGQITESATYMQDRLHGEFKLYNRNRVRERKFYQNNALEDTVRVYYDNGKIQEVSPYKNGKRHGIAQWFDTNGHVTIEYKYEDGEWIKD